jgi:hypothetical protein
MGVILRGGIMRAIRYRLVHKQGERGKLDEVIHVNGNNIVDVGRKATKLVGKLGYHGLYISQHATLGWGQWFVVCNMGVNATYAIEVTWSTSSHYWEFVPARMLAVKRGNAMSKKHFIALADMIRLHGSFEFNDPFTANQLDALAKFCACQNGQFKRERWLGYIAGECGPNGGRVKP